MSGIDLKDLFEVAMNVKEILKVNGQTKEPRVEILYNLIIQGQPIKLNSGREVVIDKRKSKEALDVLARNNVTEISTAFLPKNKIFIAVGGQAFRLNDFLKSEVFGGVGGGHGAGAVQTTAQESAQAVALAIAATMGKGVLAAEDLNIKNIKMSSSKFDVSSSIPEIVSLMDDRGWKNSFVVTTNTLLKTFPAMKRMEFYHRSFWVKALEKAFYAANSFDNKFFSHIDKWNPADIWAVAPGTAPPTPTEASNLVELKGWMQKQFDKKKIIGISLKKTGKIAEVKIINSDTEASDLLDITLRKLLVTKTNKLFSSKDSYVLFETSSLGGVLNEAAPGQVQFRSFSQDDPIQGEIKGKHASHGKVGNGPINSILSKLRLPRLTKRNDIFSMINKSETSPLKRYTKIISKIIDNAKIVNLSVARDAEILFKKKMLELDPGHVVSKFQAVELMAIIKRARQDKRDSFIQELLGFASSRTELSSVFVKIM